MSLIKGLLRKTEKIDFLFPNDFNQLMKDKYYDFDKFEWFLYYVFKLEGVNVQKVGKKGQGDGGADLIISLDSGDGYNKRIGIQAKYWKNRVGSGPINQLASAKARHNLADLWIITTSDLTTDAKEIAESLNIKILRSEDVKEFIEVVKKHYQNDVEELGESKISFLPIKDYSNKTKTQPKKETKIPIDKNGILHESLRKYRIELSKKYKLFPVYNVFNNKTLDDLALKKPTNIQQLKNIVGLGDKKINIFGQDLIGFFGGDLKTSNLDEKLYQFLIDERKNIAKYNNLKESDVYSDRVANNLVKMKPRNIEVLEKVFDFPKENIEIFGEYLVRKIAFFLDSN